MYLASKPCAHRQRPAQQGLDAETTSNSRAEGEIDCAMKFIPLWVKVAVAIALGLGTMVVSASW
jgi:phosphate/sulfate permease